MSPEFCRESVRGRASLCGKLPAQPFGEAVRSRLHGAEIVEAQRHVTPRLRVAGVLRRSKRAKSLLLPGAKGRQYSSSPIKRAGYTIPPQRSGHLLDGARLLVNLDEFLDVVLGDQGAVDVGVDLSDLTRQQVVGDTDILRCQIIGVLQRR